MKVVDIARISITNISYQGNSNLNGSSIKRENYAATMEDNIIPTHIPSTSEATTTEYYSYKNKRNPYFMDIPIALRHPYSHTFSLIFSVVDIKSKKNANIKDIAPTIPTNT